MTSGQTVRTLDPAELSGFRAGAADPMIATGGSAFSWRVAVGTLPLAVLRRLYFANRVL